MAAKNFANTENDKTVKEFSYSQDNKLISCYCCIIRRETPETETGLTWEVLKQIGNHEPTYNYWTSYMTAEMDFRNFVVESLNSDLYSTYSAQS